MLFSLACRWQWQRHSGRGTERENVVPHASIQTKMGSYSVDLEAIKVDSDINGDLVRKESCIKNQEINL